MKAAGRLCDFLKCEDGPTAVEYAVMLALIVLVCIGAIATLGSNASQTFTAPLTPSGKAGDTSAP
jgi:pilus assembly protein Flp/PilA